MLSRYCAVIVESVTLTGSETVCENASVNVMAQRPIVLPEIVNAEIPLELIDAIPAQDDASTE